MSDPRQSILQAYERIEDRLTALSMKLDTIIDTEMGSVHKQEIRAQIARMQQDFRAARWAVPDRNEWCVCNVAFFGETTAGKSTLIEALRLHWADNAQKYTEQWGSSIGSGAGDCTKEPLAYDVRLGSGILRLIDLPGIEGVLEEQNPEFSTKLEDALRTANVIFYIVGNGKKPERGTIAKVAQYLRQDARVYAVYNVHCPAKAERIPEIDGSYIDELYAEMKHIQCAMEEQARKILADQLGESFEKIYVMNAHLAFMGAAYDPLFGLSVIMPERSTLRQEQESYAREFAGDTDAMRASARLDMIVDLLQDRAARIQELQAEQQTQRLRRLIDGLFGPEGALFLLRSLADQMQREQCEYYGAQINVNAATFQFEQRITAIPRAVASKFRTKYQDLMYDCIEKHWDGTIDERRVRQFMKEHAEEMRGFVAEAVQQKINEALSRLMEEYEAVWADFERKEAMEQTRLQTLGLHFTGSGFQAQGHGLGTSVMNGLGAAVGGAAMREILFAVAKKGGANLLAGLVKGGMGLGSFIAMNVGFEVLKHILGAESQTSKAKAAACKFFERQETALADDLYRVLDELDLVGQVNKSYYDVFTNMVERQDRAYQQMIDEIEDLSAFFCRR